MDFDEATAIFERELQGLGLIIVYRLEVPFNAEMDDFNENEWDDWDDEYICLYTVAANGEELPYPLGLDPLLFTSAQEVVDFVQRIGQRLREQGLL